MALLAPPAELTKVYDQALAAATGQAVLSVRRRMRDLTPQDVAGLWATIAPSLTDSIITSQEASQIASRWYLEQSIQSTTALAAEIPMASGLVGVTAGGMSISRYVSRTPDVMAVRIANGMKPEIALAMAENVLTGLASSEAYRVGRAAVAQTAIASPALVGWRRVPEAGACSFCLMLASRGGAYTSRETAQATSKALSYHKHCRCKAEPVTTFEVMAGITTPTFKQPTIYRGGSRSGARMRGATTAASSDFYAQAPLYRPGAATSERLSQVQLQIGQIEQRVGEMQIRQSAGDVSVVKPLAWSTKRLRDLRAELASFN